MRYHQFHRFTRNLSKYGVIVCMVALPWHAAFADATTEAQLRAALQQATTQIAQLEDQVANLQAAQAPNAAMINTLQAKLQAVKQQGASPAQKLAAQKQVTALNQQLARQQAALGKLQGAYSQAATAANTAAAQNTQLTAQMAALNTQLNSCTAKNAALFQLGTQILDAYAHKDDPLAMFANHEPFIGFARV
jgi:chromosome segregation ATPase